MSTAAMILAGTCTCGAQGDACPEAVAYRARVARIGWSNPPHARPEDLYTGVPDTFVKAARRAYAAWIAGGIVHGIVREEVPGSTCYGCAGRIPLGTTVLRVGAAPHPWRTYCPECVNGPAPTA